MHGAIFKMDNKQKPIVSHMELCSMLRASLDRGGVWERMDPWICMAKSLPCSPETIRTLLISYTPIQNGFGVKNKRIIPLKSLALLPPCCISKLCLLEFSRQHSICFQVGATSV